MIRTSTVAATVGRVCVTLVATLAVAPMPRIARAQDYQLVPAGRGDANSDCVIAGPNGVIDSLPGGDDWTPFINPATVIWSGTNGICESPLLGDDTRPATGIDLGKGEPYAAVIINGSDGICQTSTVAGDDVLVAPPGTGNPRQAGVSAGANDVVDSAPGGDDVTTAVICPGQDATVTSTRLGDDLLLLTNYFCFQVCPYSPNWACIVPGPNDVLDSVVGQGDSVVGYVSTGTNGICETTATDDDEQLLPVGSGGYYALTCVNAGPDGIAQTSLCGNEVIDDLEECDSGSANADTPDTCRTTCMLPECGDGIVDLANGESCDDGNTKNNDDCVVGCATGVCGDGLKKTTGTPPFEQCDDGNVSPGDGCNAACEQEKPIRCGNRIVDPPYCSAGATGPCNGFDANCDTSPGAGDGICTTEACDDGNNSNRDDCLNNCTLASCGDGATHDRGSGSFEECDDGNVSPGDGCNASCQKECGNGLLDGACSQGLVGLPCLFDEECETSAGAGDGTCVTESCDITLDGLCLPGPITCSALCTIASCGNGQVECSEECDLAAANGLPGSGCTALCERTLVGSQELRKDSECPGAWTMDSPPQDLKYRRQACTDGGTCDFDGTVNGECLLSIGMCVNRPLPIGCIPAPVVAVDITRLDTAVPWIAAAAEQLTGALAALTSQASQAPGRCRQGRSRKNCEVNASCDSYLGAGDGICDVATGVAYDPPLDAFGDEPNQLMPCTPGQPVTIPVGERVTMRSYVRRVAPMRGDRDTLRLRCVAP